jgi:hypothetical protein
VTLAFFSMFGMFFLLTQYLQFVKGYSPLGAGIRTLPNAVVFMALSAQSPKIIARFGVKKALRTGFYITAVGFALFAVCTASTPYIVVALALTCTGLGGVLIMPCASQHIVGSLPLSKAGVGSAVNDVTREVGGALGIAVAGSIVATVYRGRDFVDVIPNEEARHIAGESVGQAFGVARNALENGFIDQAQFHSFVSAAADAFNDGTSVAFGLMALVATMAGTFIARVIPDELPSREVPHHPRVEA